MRLTPALAFAVLLAPLASPAGEPAAYALDPVHTRVLVAVGHAGFSQALGTVSGSEGALLFDPGDWRSARLEVRVPLARLDFGDADWNRAVAARNLLDTTRYPEARFSSERVEPVDATHARVCGTLQLHGVARPQCLDVTLNAIERHPMPPFRRTAGFSATAQLSRADFGIDAWTSVIGDTVSLRIEAEAVRDDDARAAFEPAPAPGADVTPATPDANEAMEAAAAAALEAAASDDPSLDDADDGDVPPPRPEPLP
ncbi:YceI family protein [Marilutibacter aestuarii]|uniref:Polyisoprenoid-binding protein n=1 Tax=Marilutibacter aestuarii TaxID=1706195 RepID=A0A508AJ45_9GAMM|nr:YceI family protein [Lysobacter aestuarii]TQD48913.1 polyisoprenoid-binding protein [Lysobacter aestuarii]